TVTNVGIGVAVVVFAAVARPPHVEIVYLLLIPLLSSIFLSSWLTGLMGAVTIIVLIGFRLWMGPAVPTDVATDLMGFIGLCTVILVAIGWQRARYESERQRMALEAQRGELMQSVLESISHDFRTPLAIIGTSLYLLEKDRTDEGRAKRIKRIREQATRLNAMVDEILAAAREGPDITLTYHRADLSELMVKCVDGLRPVAALRSVELVVAVSEEPVPIWCHPPSIERMLVNLIENAMNYSEDAGTVTVSAVKQTENVMLSVQDTGIGISPEHLPYIFEPFYRADEARSTRTGGSGLGLTSVKRIVDAHDGSINVESKEGVGTRFEVVFPLLSRVRKVPRKSSTQSN
ncbi:MAG: HAMP domain-containing sensor histidine kinase, partial [Chloroflexota bacterium]